MSRGFTKNFIVRFWCSIIMFTLVGVSLPFANGLYFKILYVISALVSSIELLSFFKNRHHKNAPFLAVIELCLLIGGGIFVISADLPEIILALVGVCSYDVSAYIFGHLLGGRFMPDARPFPHISKNKTWEGTILGLVFAVLFTLLVLVLLNSYQYLFLLAGPLALIGDLTESLLKRCFSIKDSNEIVIKYKFFEILELLVGGREGHGGYLDRLDSFAFTTTILWLLSSL